MNMLRALAIAILSLVLGVTPLYAQQATDAPDQDTKESQKNQATNEASAPPATPPPATTDDTPFDYGPSEEISEDLSVSFPVDI